MCEEVADDPADTAEEFAVRAYALFLADSLEREVGVDIALDPAPTKGVDDGEHEDGVAEAARPQRREVQLGYEASGL